MKFSLAVFGSLITLLAPSATAAEAATAEVKLYTLDCGTINVSDMASFDRNGRFAGQSITLKVPCYLIRHPKGDLVWDTGYDDELASKPEGQGTVFHATMDRTLEGQLADLGLRVEDVEFLSLSHWHPDHSGNANLFGASTWIVNRAERTFMFSDEMKSAQPGYSALQDANTILFDTTYDVFGDGSAVIHSTPGHTPGHSVLMLTLENTGPLLFSGDLHIFEEGRSAGAIPTFNSDVEQTIRSMQLFEKLALDHGARIVIEHDKNHFEALPRFPTYLD